MENCRQCLDRFRAFERTVAQLKQPHEIVPVFNPKVMDLWLEARTARDRYMAALADAVMKHDPLEKELYNLAARVRVEEDLTLL